MRCKMRSIIEMTANPVFVVLLRVPNVHHIAGVLVVNDCFPADASVGTLSLSV